MRHSCNEVHVRHSGNGSASLQCPRQGYALAESTECSGVLNSQLLRLDVDSMYLVGAIEAILFLYR